MKDRIKEIRKHYKETQQSFGDALNISKSTIEALEYGRREATDRIISDICRVYGVSRDWLETGEGEMLATNSREAEIARITAQMFRDDESSFRFQLQRIISEMSDEQIELLRDIAKKLAEIYDVE